MKRLFLVFTILFCISFASAQNPFEAYGYTPKIATLSNGKYNEFHDLDTVVQIGTVLFNTQSKQIVAFLQVDTLYSEATLQPDIVSMWISPDPLSDENQGISPYNYCHWNPIVITDPDGRDDNDPYWHDKITDKIVYTNHNSPPTTIDGDWEYMGETLTSVDKNGNTEYHDECNRVSNSVLLSESSISAQAPYKSTIAYALFGELASGKLDAGPYGPATTIPTPDYVGVSVNGNAIVGGGFGGNVTFGYVKGDGGFLNASFNQGVGFDISAGVSITAGNYTGKGKPTATSLAGPFTYQNLGAALNVSTFQDVESNFGKLGIGHNWQGGSLNFNIGSKTAWGGSTGTSLTTKPLKLW